MEQIIIEVEDATAKKWHLSSKKTKDKVSQRITIKLAKELMTESKEEFKQFLDEIGKTMEERGLTKEILNDILKDEE